MTPKPTLEKFKFSTEAVDHAWRKGWDPETLVPLKFRFPREGDLFYYGEGRVWLANRDYHCTQERWIMAPASASPEEFLE